MLARYDRTRHVFACLASAVAAAFPVISSSGCSQVTAEPAAAGERKTATDESLIRVQTVRVEPRNLERKIELPGTVEGYETADLYSKIGGYLAEISVDIGDTVARDQVIARLSVPEMEKELLQKQAAVTAAQADAEQAEAALQEAKTELREKEAQVRKQLAELNRISGLVERGSLNKKLLDEVTYAHDAAQSALDTAHAKIKTAEAALNSGAAQVKLAAAERDRVEAMLSYSQIRAPFPGIVTRRFVHPGAFIQSADGNSSARPLVSISRIDLVRVSLDLPMSEVKWLERGDRVVFDRINVLPGVSFEGKVARFATALDHNSRMMRVEVDLENPNQQLLPGYYGYATVYLDEMAQTPVVPSSALFQAGSETCVYVVENGMCHRRPVSTCFHDGILVGIASGLAAGEAVVASGAGQLRDRQQVVAASAGAMRVAFDEKTGRGK